MKLSENHLKKIRFHMEGLLERVRELRDSRGVSAPPDTEMSLIFTDGDDYEVERDRLVDFHLAIIRGISIGLDLVCPSDLYRVYCEGLDDHHIPDLSMLVQASERALVHLKEASSKRAREVVNELGIALSPFKGREWR